MGTDLLLREAFREKYKLIVLYSRKHTFDGLHYTVHKRLISNSKYITFLIPVFHETNI